MMTAFVFKDYDLITDIVFLDLAAVVEVVPETEGELAEEEQVLVSDMMTADGQEITLYINSNHEEEEDDEGGASVAETGEGLEGGADGGRGGSQRRSLLKKSYNSRRPLRIC